VRGIARRPTPEERGKRDAALLIWNLEPSFAALDGGATAVRIRSGAYVNFHDFRMRRACPAVGAGFVLRFGWRRHTVLAVSQIERGFR